ncbi:MAG: hypothetical protein ACK6BG_10735 [Cyanobacteriota bacterium]
MALGSGLPTGCTGAGATALALERRGAGRWVGAAMGVVEEGVEWPAEARAERLERVEAMGVQRMGKT